jgi:PilZ domain
MIEHRSQPRRRHLREARLVFNNRTSTLTCIVRDMSASGARITLDRADTVPDRFEFALKGRAPISARKIWARMNELGVSFR